MKMVNPVALRIFKYGLFVGGAVVGISLLFTRTDTYQIAASFVRESEDIKTIVGVPFHGFAILTGLKKNPDGPLGVNIGFNVIGPNGHLWADVFLHKHGNGWLIVTANAVDPTGTPHNLLNEVLYVDSTGWTALHFAAAQGKLEQIRSLLDKGSALEARNDKGRTPLYVAAIAGKVEAVRHLLGRGADVNAKNGDVGFTALHIAAEYHHPPVVKLLLESSANVNAINVWDQTPLHQAAWQAWHKDSAIASILLDHGAAIDAKDNHGWTPLLKAAQAGHTQFVALLISRGADLNAKCDCDKNALYLASENGHLQIVRLLLDAGADVNAKAAGWTALRIAQQNGYTQIADLLRQRGAKREL